MVPQGEYRKHTPNANKLTSWTKLSFCWAFSRNPETLPLCFCPCHGQSAPPPPAPLLPCVWVPLLPSILP